MSRYLAVTNVVKFTKMTNTSLCEAADELCRLPTEVGNFTTPVQSNFVSYLLDMKTCHAIFCLYVRNAKNFGYLKSMFRIWLFGCRFGYSKGFCYDASPNRANIKQSLTYLWATCENNVHSYAFIWYSKYINTDQFFFSCLVLNKHNNHIT